MNVKVNIGDENIILSDDITLPRVAFISNRSRRERNPKIIELALNSALVSGSSNVLKVRDLRTTVCPFIRSPYYGPNIDRSRHSSIPF